MKHNCSRSPVVWDDEKPGRRLTDTEFDYRSPQEVEKTLRHPPVELSIYGEAFQGIAAGRLASTSDIPLHPQTIDAATYKKWPETWTDQMNREFGLCEDCEDRKLLIQEFYEKTYNHFGNWTKWLRKTRRRMHERMLRLCEGIIDRQGRRIRASAMLHEGNQ
jgi:hypothetical protein